TVKTRIAAELGEEVALIVHRRLVNILRENMQGFRWDIQLCFSDFIPDDIKEWGTKLSDIQKGKDLGEKMYNALSSGFELGYHKVCLAGSDIPDLDKEIVYTAFEALEKADVVLGPATDGGYYLIGGNEGFLQFKEITENMNWGTEEVLLETTDRLEKRKVKYHLLKQLSDIDYISDFPDTWKTEFRKTSRSA
ncbi:MAG: TIGR04282 family arsenosugar biosynthesis glycosyltransferase, partial [Cyclobacteriaceae bacterium]|nr:TIGR04282 family arsenosugar biosynthesis glycosyltransferase [Cyclobacteriaceae bacterium]